MHLNFQNSAISQKYNGKCEQLHVRVQQYARRLYRAVAKQYTDCCKSAPLNEIQTCNYAIKKNVHANSG